MTDPFDKQFKRIVHNESLLITGFQEKTAVGAKAFALAYIHPLDFIKATTGDRGGTMDSIIESSKSLEEYNEFAADKEICCPPFLKLMPRTQQIKGHEGRHRMAAAHKAGFERAPFYLMFYHQRLKAIDELEWPLEIEYQYKWGEYFEIPLTDIIEFHLWK